MKNYSLADLAQHDLEDIWAYIANDNLKAADRVHHDIHAACEKLSHYPFIGAKRTDLTQKPFRFWSVHSHFIIYDPETSPLRVIRILSQHRDITKLL